MNQNTIAVALLRPGYTDPRGHHSEGDDGKRNGDNWNATNTGAIANAIKKLEVRYNTQKVIVAGHSGGAAITANILGLYPELIDAALLVSCPCGYVNKWRKHMFQFTGLPVFKGPIHSLPPITLVENISEEVSIIMMTGTEDKVAPLRISKKYQSAALNAGKNVILIKLPDRHHNTFIYSKVFKKLSEIINRIREK